MNTTAATTTTTADALVAVITGTELVLEARGYRITGHGVTPATRVVFSESRPATLADAELALKAHGYGLAGSWDLGPQGTVTAAVEPVDNLFNGTRAARLELAIGTTHGPLEQAPAGSVDNGDIITDEDQCVLLVVAGCSLEGDSVKIHQVGDGQVWDDRYTGEFPTGQWIWVARRKA